MPTALRLDREEQPLSLIVVELRPGNDDRPDSDQADTDHSGERQLLFQENGGDDRNQHNTELVDRGNLGRLPDIEGAKVTDPGSSRRQTGQHQKRDRAPRQRFDEPQLTRNKQDHRHECQNDERANKSCDVGWNALHADFREHSR